MLIYRIHITGLVQGVGFRPFVYRMAMKHGLKGTVENRNDGVVIVLAASQKEVESFLDDLRKMAPPASNIESITLEQSESDEKFFGFSIVKSQNISGEVTEVSPDICVCSECLADLKKQANRIDYPFINCTNCGPRFTIIGDLPYDREKTSMQPFVMCESCHKEYIDILDRRFHAQPVACKDCGPQYEMILGGRALKDIEGIIAKTARILESGGILAIKGMGGFFLACNALDGDACKRLREFKNRDGKPFAVMFRDMDTLRQYTEVNKVESELLQSWRRPVVLLNSCHKYHSQSLRAKSGSGGDDHDLDPAVLPDAVNSGLNRIGCMLPYMPFHLLLFGKTSLPAIVMTSGNFSEEPIIIDNGKAVELFSSGTDGILIYNRDIVNRCDDSVTFVVNEKPRIIRRSRGYVPNPIRLDVGAEGILACGAELKNTFCIGKGNQAILSQHIGDLKNFETFEFYAESIQRFSRLFRFDPRLITCDLHPDYLSSKYAAESGLPVFKVQHHHAHIASVLAEHRKDEKVIGVSFDGTGLGHDGAIWGGEFLICDLEKYERFRYFDYVPMPGGDAAGEQPWRMALAYLHKTFGDSFLGFDLPFLRNVDLAKARLILQAIDKNLNCPPTSSAGRLFDAVAALTNVCMVHTFEAEAPMRLESIIDKSCDESYPLESIGQRVVFDTMIFEIVNDLMRKTAPAVIAAKFHNTIAEVVETTCKAASNETGITTVALSGGVFQNATLLGMTESRLERSGFKVITNLSAPANDGGIALGQLAVAAAMRKQ